MERRVRVMRSATSSKYSAAITKAYYDITISHDHSEPPRNTSPPSTLLRSSAPPPLPPSRALLILPLPPAPSPPRSVRCARSLRGT